MSSISRAILLLLSFCCCSAAQSQSFEEVERSLFEQLKNAETQEDSIDIYNDISFNYRRTHPEKIAPYADKAIHLGQSIGYTKGLAQAYKNKGIAYYKLNPHQDSAVFYYDQAIAYAERIDDYYTIAACTNNIGLLKVGNLEFDQAIKDFLFTIKLIDSLKIQDAHFLKALAFGNLGDCFLNKEKYEEAIVYLEQAIKIGKQYDKKIISSIYLDELAMCYLEVGKDDEAIVLMDKVLTIQEQLKDYESQIELLLRYSNIELEKGKAENALQYSNQAKELTILHEINHFSNRVLLSIAKCYFEMGNLDEAEKYANASHKSAMPQKSGFGELYTFELLNKIYVARGDYETAYQYLDQTKELQQQLNDERRAIVAEEAIAAYDNDLRIKSLEEERHLQNSWMKSLLIFSFVIMVLFFVVFSLYQKRNKLANELNQKNKEITTQSEELQQLSELKDKLFSTISHDLKGPIANFEQALRYLLSGELKQKEFLLFAEDLKGDAMHLRKSVEELMNWSYMQMVGLQPKATDINLNEIVEQTIQANQKIAGAKKVLFKNKLSNKLFVKADQEHLNSIVRNLISNAIKFSNDGSTITFRAYQEQERVVFSIEDQGIGIETTRLQDIFHAGSTTWGTAGEKGTGLGLALCKEFVEQNDGKIWTVSKVGSGSTFFVALPIGMDSSKTQSLALSSAVL